MDTKNDFLGRGWKFPPTLDPRRGGVETVEGEADVHEAIRIILETAKGERVMRPDFGCGIHELVFAAIDSFTIGRIQTEVADALRLYEPRIDLQSVEVDPARLPEGWLDIRIAYRVRRTN